VADFIKGLAEVKQNEISLRFLIDGFEKIIDLYIVYNILKNL